MFWWRRNERRADGPVTATYHNRFFATANWSRLHTFMKRNQWNVTRENKVWSKTKTPDERGHMLRRECLDLVEWFSFQERDGPQIIFTSTLRLALQHDTEGWWEERRGRAGADGMTVRQREVTLHPQLCNMCVICLWGFCLSESPNADESVTEDHQSVTKTTQMLWLRKRKFTVRQEEEYIKDQQSTFR